MRDFNFLGLPNFLPKNLIFTGFISIIYSLLIKNIIINESDFNRFFDEKPKLLQFLKSSAHEIYCKSNISKFGVLI